MACPYFMPVAKLENGTWPHPSRLPLGGGWNGHCTAPGHEGEQPTQDIVEAFCNLGYAECCGWAPRERTCDAVRFAVTAPAEEKNTATRANRLVLRFVCERSHWPVEHGSLAFDLANMVWLKPHPDPRIQKMAECFLQTYLQKKA